MSGYVSCACRDCFEIAIASNTEGEENFCHDCDVAGCELSGDCQAQIDLTELVDQHCDELSEETTGEHNILCKCKKCIADITSRDPRKF